MKHCDAQAKRDRLQTKIGLQLELIFTRINAPKDKKHLALFSKYRHFMPNSE